MGTDTGFEKVSARSVYCMNGELASAYKRYQWHAEDMQESDLLYAREKLHMFYFALPIASKINS